MTAKTASSRELLIQKANLRAEISTITACSRRKIKSNASVLIARKLEQIEAITQQLS